MFGLTRHWPRGHANVLATWSMLFSPLHIGCCSVRLSLPLSSSYALFTLFCLFVDDDFFSSFLSIIFSLSFGIFLQSLVSPVHSYFCCMFSAVAQKHFLVFFMLKRARCCMLLLPKMQCRFCLLLRLSLVCHRCGRPFSQSHIFLQCTTAVCVV